MPIGQRRPAGAMIVGGSGLRSSHARQRPEPTRAAGLSAHDEHAQMAGVAAEASHLAEATDAGRTERCCGCSAVDFRSPSSRRRMCVSLASVSLSPAMAMSFRSQQPTVEHVAATSETGRWPFCCAAQYNAALQPASTRRSYATGWDTTKLVCGSLEVCYGSIRVGNHEQAPPRGIGAGEGNRTLDPQLGKLAKVVETIGFSCKPCIFAGVAIQ